MLGVTSVRGQRVRLSSVRVGGVIVIEETMGIVQQVMRPPGNVGQGRAKIGTSVVWFEMGSKTECFYWGTSDPWVIYVGQGIVEAHIRITDRVMI
jgi:hypothetical protein